MRVLVFLCVISALLSASPSDAQLRTALESYRYVEAYQIAERQLRERYTRFGLHSPKTADSILALGQIAEASTYLSHANELASTALQLYREHSTGDDPRIVRALTLCARVWSGESDSLSARVTAYVDEAYAMARRLGDESLLADLERAEGNQLRIEGDLPGASASYRRALSLRRQCARGPSVSVADDLTWLAFIEQMDARVDSSRVHYELALRELDDLDLEYHPLRATALNGLASIESAFGSLPVAAVLARASIRQSSRVRMWQMNPQRHWGLEAHMTLADVLLREGRDTEAWTTIRGALGTRTREALAWARARRDDAPFAHTARADSLGLALVEVEEQLASVARLRHSTDAATRTAGRESAAPRTFEEIDLLVRTVRLRAAILDARGAPLETTASSARPPEGTAFVGWFATGAASRKHSSAGRRVWGYVVRATGEPHWALLGEWRSEDAFRAWIKPVRGRQTALAAASRWRFTLEADAAVDSLAAVAWRRLFSPIAEHLEGIEHLVVLPAQSLGDVVVESLVDDSNRYVGDLFDISYAASPGAYVETLVQPRRDSILVFCDPDYGGVMADADTMSTSIVGEALLRSVLDGNSGAVSRLSPLPHSRSEGEAVASMFPRHRLFTGKEASESKLKELGRSGELAEYSIVHIAAHGLFDGKFPLRSAIVLAPDSVSADRPDDGIITSSTVGESWKLDADLLVLSACQTAYRSVSFDGGVFVTPGFRAGARAVLASRWKVNDHATFLLMRRFYQNLTGSESMSAAHALRESRTWLRTWHDAGGDTPYAHPVYWSSFALFGNPR
jgi:CHAT domain-containing protein/tetratricopeptide (TPR) repeat protein